MAAKISAGTRVTVAAKIRGAAGFSGTAKNQLGAKLNGWFECPGQWGNRFERRGDHRLFFFVSSECFREQAAYRRGPTTMVYLPRIGILCQGRSSDAVDHAGRHAVGQWARVSRRRNGRLCGRRQFSDWWRVRLGR